MSLALLFALVLSAQDVTAGTAPVADAPVVDQGREAVVAQAAAASASGAPTDDFGFVAWCSGALDGYLDMKPRVLPEVRRIESSFREPGRTLAQDMKVYADLEKDGLAGRVAYRKALLAAEHGDPALIQVRANAYAHGRAVWAAPADAPPARLAQEWMSWTLPGRCDTAVQHLGDPAGLFAPADKTTVGADAGAKSPAG